MEHRPNAEPPAVLAAAGAEDPSAVAGRDGAAVDRVLPEVYDELRRLARRQLRSGPPGATLSATALVHEVYLKLARSDGAPPRDRAHLLALAARAMRQILVDAARRRAAGKRGGATPPSTLDDEVHGAEPRLAEVLAVDDALDALSRLDPRLGRLVELRFFAGLSVEETAAVLGVSDRTVKRDWRKARAYLFHALESRGGAA